MGTKTLHDSNNLKRIGALKGKERGRSQKRRVSTIII